MWAQVPDFPGYEINRDTQQVRGRRGSILKPRPDKRGRIWIALYRGGKQYSVKLAHIMLLTFVGSPVPGQVSRHRDDDPGHNTLGNLCWGTQSENMYDKVANGLHWNANKTHCPRQHAYTSENTYVSKGKRSCRRCAADRAREKRRVV